MLLSLSKCFLLRGISAPKNKPARKYERCASSSPFLGWHKTSLPHLMSLLAFGKEAKTGHIHRLNLFQKEHVWLCVFGSRQIFDCAKVIKIKGLDNVQVENNRYYKKVFQLPQEGPYPHSTFYFARDISIFNFKPNCQLSNVFHHVGDSRASSNALYSSFNPLLCRRLLFQGMGISWGYP